MMRNTSLLLLSGLSSGFESFAGRNKSDPRIGYVSKNGPPGLKTFDSSFLSVVNRTTIKDGSNYSFNLSLQMEKDSTNELSYKVEAEHSPYRETKFECWL